MKSYVLISMNEGSESRFVKELRSYHQIKSAHLIFGEWDIIAEIEVPKLEDLSTFLTDKIRPKDEVKLTSSLIVAGE